MLNKMMAHNKDLTIEDALDYATWVRNVEIRRHGLSPYQIVYGNSPFLPGITKGNIISDQDITEPEAIRKHFRRQEIA